MNSGFHFADGSVAQDTKELLDILETKDNEITFEHVLRGDYALWIKTSLQDEVLASRVEKCRSVQQVIDVLRLEHIPVAKHREKKVEHVHAHQHTHHEETLVHDTFMQQKHQHHKNMNKVVDEVFLEEKKPDVSDEDISRIFLQNVHEDKPAEKKTFSDESKIRVEIPQPITPIRRDATAEMKQFFIGLFSGVILTIIVYGIIGLL